MRGRGEEGAVFVFFALIVVLLVPLCALAVDLGMQRVVRRDMQALADVVALDLSRELGGRTQAQLAPVIDPASSTSALSQSVARNNSVLGDAPTVTAELGSWDGTTFDKTTDPPTAVRVTAQGSVDFAFSAGEGNATRTAIGSTIKSACYSLGSFAARFRSGDSALISTLVSPMNELLRPQANLDAVAYTGLAGASASLEELALAGNLGSTDQLFSATLTSRKLITMALSALKAGSPINTVAVNALDQLLKGQAALDTPVLLTDVVSISPSDTAALQTDFSVLDLAAGAILVADGDHGFKLGNGNLGTRIAGVASLSTAELKVVGKPQPACGAFGSTEARATSSQVAGTAAAKFELPTINLGGGDIIQTAPATVQLNVNLGNAAGQLAGEPVCNSGTAVDPDRLQVTVQSGIATYSLTTTLGFKTTINVAGLGNVDVIWEQKAGAGQPMPDTSTTADLVVPPNDTTPYSTGGGDAGLGGVTVATTATNITATLKTTGASVPVTTVEPLIQPLVTALASHATVDGRLDTLAAGIDSYLSPLLTLFGLNVSGADVFAIGRPVCGAPVLRG